jgi:hypothetical protein
MDKEIQTLEQDKHAWDVLNAGFCCFWSRCPMVVAMDFGILRCTLAAKSMGIDLKKPWSMDLVHVPVIGLKHETWRNLMVLLLIWFV